MMMKIFGFSVGRTKAESRSFEDYNNYNPVMGFLNFGGTTYSESKALKLSTVYRCVNLISDSIAKLELNVYEYNNEFKYKQYNDLYYLINVQPNRFMGGFTFKKTMVVHILLRGNAYIKIDRDLNNNIKELLLLNPDLIQVSTTAKGIEYKYNGIAIDSDDVIHIAGYSTNGIVGESVLSYSANTLGLAYDSEVHARNFFSSGANASGILKPTTGGLTEDKARKAKDTFINSLNPSIGGQTNSVIVLDAGLEYQPIQVSPKDSQLLETRTFNVIDICRFFAVPPSLVFDGNNKYNSVEQAQLDFLNTCLQSYIEKIENEFFRKIFLRSEWSDKDIMFDTDNIFRLDAITRAEYFTKMYQLGAITTNDIRLKTSNVPVVGGNRSFIQVNLQPIDNLIYDGKESDTNKPIDNKLK